HHAGRLQFFGNHAHLAGKAAFKAWLAPLHRNKWFVYSKRPLMRSSVEPRAEQPSNTERTGDWAAERKASKAIP
ncbi:MAG: hypothetical protein ABSE61_34245, partial [Bradyrhizobium sp.]